MHSPNLKGDFVRHVGFLAFFGSLGEAEIRHQ